MPFKGCIPGHGHNVLCDTSGYFSTVDMDIFQSYLLVHGHTT
jgi:hypothetical protein